MLEIMPMIMIVGIFYLDANETAAADNIQIQAFAAVASYQGKQPPWVLPILFSDHSGSDHVGNHEVTIVEKNYSWLIGAALKEIIRPRLGIRKVRSIMKNWDQLSK